MAQFTVPALSYDYDALQPAISEAIMRLHHDVHHNTYVTKLNAALEGVDSIPQEGTDQHKLKAVLANLDSLPESIRTAVRNNGGGHYNHSFFWEVMTPGGAELSGELKDAIENRYGSFDSFKEEFTNKALGLFGSGWVWLQPNLDIIALPNQDTPIMDGGEVPILGLDVWEHAYYLDYNAARKDYVDAWWGVVDWDFVSKQYTR